MLDRSSENPLSRLKQLVNDYTSRYMPERVPIAIKLALAITLLIVCGMSMLGLTILNNQKSIMTEQMLGMGTTIANQLAGSSQDMVLSDDILGLKTLINNLIDDQNILGATIISEKGQPLAEIGITPDISVIHLHTAQTIQPKKVHHFTWISLNDHYESEELITFISPIHFNNLIAGHFLITFTKESMAKSLQQSMRLIIIVTVFMTFLAILIAFIMSRHLSKPIHTLVDASKAIGEGDLNFRIYERRNDEIGELADSFNQMADGLLKKSQVENVFSRFVSSNVAKEIMDNLDEVQLGGKHVHASVLFADIVGFTSISEKLPPNEIADLLNEYFSYISTISKYFNGHIDKFIGDCVMVVFGVPEHTPNHSLNAIACAVMIQRLAARLNVLNKETSHPTINFRIGINSGHMVAGNLGSHDRMEYTVIGDPVNIASRLSSVAESNQIVIMEELYNHDDIKDKIFASPYETIQVRGKEIPVSTYLVHSLSSGLQKNIDAVLDEILQK
ncbi:MAG: HAMP domain-containing protein [Gammaproteobacteria bacterium]|nr:HAMP domain-containing protein [Gammaproteobacteria bacterium]MDH5734526.1 HAMP domain-containing protein [Gammaproteobacteria bacterium]